MSRRGGRSDGRAQRAAHAAALDRPEIMQPTSPRAHVAGSMTGLAQKVVDAVTRELVDAAVLDHARKALTDAERRALISGRDRGDVTAHLEGRSAWGGWTATEASMRRKGLLQRVGQLTDFGRRVAEGL